MPHRIITRPIGSAAVTAYEALFAYAQERLGSDSDFNEHAKRYEAIQADLQESAADHEAHAHFVETAQNDAEDGVMEIDDTAVISLSHTEMEDGRKVLTGAYVEAWYYVNLGNDELE